MAYIDSRPSTGTWSINLDTSNTSGDVLSAAAKRQIGSSMQRRSSGQCNESSKHDNQEKALFHGLKSAYRMSRSYDGREYGTPGSPPLDQAARIAASVASAFFETADFTYTREESHEYVSDGYMKDPGLISRAQQFFGGSLPEVVDMEAAIGQAWKQVDDKGNHYDAARTALAAAELHLDEELHP